MYGDSRSRSISMKSIQEADQDLQIVKGWLENGRPDSKVVEGS